MSTQTITQPSPLDDAREQYLDELDAAARPTDGQRVHARAAFEAGWKAAQADAAERIREEADGHRYRVDVLALPSDLLGAIDGLAAELDEEAQG
jgi:hypothetical protein